jgi:hypothetical protein
MGGLLLVRLLSLLKSGSADDERDTDTASTVSEKTKGDGQSTITDVEKRPSRQERILVGEVRLSFSLSPLSILKMSPL